ncbi:MAG: hypothetical protein RLZZ458_1017, partial [Planctomycetota bacterium]
MKKMPQRLGTNADTPGQVMLRNSILSSGLRKFKTGLENRSTREGTQGSNPCLSASVRRF